MNILRIRDVLSAVDDDQCLQWFDAYRESLLHWLEPAEHEFLRHYMACVLVVSTEPNDPLKQFTRLSQWQHALQVRPV